MTLSEFILAHVDTLLDDWTGFARSVPAARELDLVGLRDHAEEMLRAIAVDMLGEQSAVEQRVKSEGRAARISRVDTAAERHGSARRCTGFELEQMVGEFRALRATVVCQWLLVERPTSPEALLELVRFNEALDQAVSESLARFVREVDEARELFLAVIAHDMRSPIGASLNAARYLRRLPEIDARAANAVDVVLRSDERLNTLTDEILELVQLKLRASPSVSASPVDLGVLCGDMLAGVRAAHPGTTVTMDAQGDLRGEWDAGKLERVLVNLIENAFKHGAAGAPVRVVLAGREDEVEATVSNAGDAIPSERLAHLFEPMTAWTRGDDRLPATLRSYGLGLFIVREIVEGHGGRVVAESGGDDGTTFRVTLPRRSRPGTRGPAGRR